LSPRASVCEPGAVVVWTSGMSARQVRADQRDLGFP
jgi:hypothetical protein